LSVSTLAALGRDLKGESMRITITLPRELGRELKAAAAALQEPHYGPAEFACDLVAAEMASTRLPRIAPGRYGARVNGAEKPEDPPEPYRISWSDIAAHQEACNG